MRLAVIIATYGRKALLTCVLSHLTIQSRLPDRVIISVPDASHAEVPDQLPFEVEVVTGASGLPAQRNRGLEQALGDCDIITFFDDDFLPGRHYLGRVVHGFAQNPDWAVATGRVVADGISGPGMDFDQGSAVLRDADQSGDASALGEIADRIGAYGCNMSIRTAMIGPLRFDERLVLYGWQEDTDFSIQLARHGRTVRVTGLIGVHLGIKLGRVSGVRFGYSQITNPVYLMKKGTVPRGFALNLMARNVIANIAKSLWPEPYVDRFGRLKGNFLAARHILTGRIEPEYILKL